MYFVTDSVEQADDEKTENILDGFDKNYMEIT